MHVLRLLSALIGLVVALLWVLCSREQKAADGVASIHPRVVVPWRQFAASSSLRWLVLSYACLGYVAYIYMSWFYLYLVNVRGIDLLRGGWLAAAPFVAILVFCPLGGWTTDRLVSTLGLTKARMIVGMIGMAYASVPLYAIFCQMTGYGGTTQRVEQFASRVLDRKMTVRFDTNVAGGLPWDFKPVAREVTSKIGETTQADFTVTNLFDTPTSGRAQFNVTPESAGVYFNKVHCFCFDDTRLKPGETRTMPVVFYVDPAITEMAELAEIYMPVFGKQFFENKPQLMHVLPVEETITVQQEALPFEKVSSLIEHNQSFLVNEASVTA